MGKIKLGIDDTKIFVAHICLIGLLLNSRSCIATETRYNTLLIKTIVYLAGGMGQNFKEFPVKQMVLLLKVPYAFPRTLAAY